MNEKQIVFGMYRTSAAICIWSRFLSTRENADRIPHGLALYIICRTDYLGQIPEGSMTIFCFGKIHSLLSRTNIPGFKDVLSRYIFFKKHQNLKIEK